MKICLLRFVLLASLFVHSICIDIKTNDDYLVLENFKKTENTALNAPIANSLIGSDALDCTLYCVHESECFSFNIVKSSSGSGFICELLTVDKYHPNSPPLIANMTSSHHSPKDPCAHNKCDVQEDFKHCTRLYKKPGPRYQCPKTTCYHIKTAFPSSSSGSYTIDPDGEGGTSPFTVYCDMIERDGIGVTVISHNKEARALVKGSEPAGSIVRDITYDGANIAQLKALTAASTRCEQFIKYECYHSNLWHTTWWVSRDGGKMTSWGGAPIGSDQCECAVSNTCAGGRKCNCAMNDSKWRVDSGFLNSRSHLPVIQLRFGDLGGSVEKGYYTLGKLKCF